VATGGGVWVAAGGHVPIVSFAQTAAVVIRSQCIYTQRDMARLRRCLMVFAQRCFDGSHSVRQRLNRRVGFKKGALRRNVIAKVSWVSADR